MEMGYFAHKPSPPLSDFVEHFWLLHNFPAPAKQMILPDGGFEIILNCGVPQRLHHRLDTQRFELHRDGWISGLRHEPIVIGTPGPMSILGVRFKMLGAYRFLRVPLHELTDRVIDASLVFGSTVLKLRDHIACAPTPQQRFRLFEEFLLQRLSAPVRTEVLIEGAVNRLSQELFEGRVGELVDEMAIGSKHLRRLFRDHVGISPKSVFRIHRFQRVIGYLEKAPRADWAALAARFGFHDQAHLVKEFRVFTDSPPTQYLLRRGPYLNYLTVDEPMSDFYKTGG